ncbi:phage tail protein [Pseudomonas sp. H9]|uniref:phage tail protein n=1 Tax=Pseudomonas sp. H9 TaxID=483968 RepID=UPI00105816C2|nr:phage tail protein [Pseudomonas sp. H9]TDF78231.1 phage tail protein [Pseudomonas sp. H9]
MIFFSKTTGGFYSESVHSGEQIPVDAVHITQEHHAELLAGQPMGLRISSDKDGYPILIEPPQLTAEQLIAIERSWRDSAVESVRWLRERHRDEVDSARPTTLTPAQSGELLDYVQALRDWPQSELFPDSQYRPEAPPWTAEHTY